VAALWILRVCSGCAGDAKHMVDAAKSDAGAAGSGGQQLQAGNFAGGMLAAVGVDPTGYIAGAEPFTAFLR
jgi:hypothetical protein